MTVLLQFIFLSIVVVDVVSAGQHRGVSCVFITNPKMAKSKFLNKTFVFNLVKSFMSILFYILNGSI